jgi:hypothetical protein
MNITKLNYIYFLIFIIGFFLYSCGKNDNPNEKSGTKEVDSSEFADTVQMTPAESFSNAMCESILEGKYDEDLQIFLEEEIYPIVSKSDNVTFDRLSASLYLLSYKDGNEIKNILFQKHYNPQTDEIYFTKEGVTFDAKKYYIE